MCATEIFLHPGTVFHYTNTLHYKKPFSLAVSHRSSVLARKTFKNKRHFQYVHLIMLGVPIVLPCIPLAAVLATGGWRLASFPPFQCFARNNNVIYYTFILPASIMMATGITLIILILHVLYSYDSPTDCEEFPISWLYAHLK